MTRTGVSSNHAETDISFFLSFLFFFFFFDKFSKSLHGDIFSLCPRVFFILHAHVVCTLTGFFLVFFCFCFFFSREISRHYIPDTVQPIQVFSFARSRFLLYSRVITTVFTLSIGTLHLLTILVLYILVRLMSNFFSFHSKNLIKYTLKNHIFTCYIENLLNFSIPLSHISK